MKQILDKGLGKLMSRKLMVWLTACVFLGTSSLDSSDWVAVTLVYLGVQGLADLAATWKHGRS
jgi:hypothetical protein